MKLIVSTFLVYKVKKCLLKSGKVILKSGKVSPLVGLSMPVGWALRDHVMGIDSPCAGHLLPVTAGIECPKYGTVSGQYREISWVSCFYDTSCCFYDTSMILLVKEREKYHFCNSLSFSCITYYFKYKMRLWYFFREKISFVCKILSIYEPCLSVIYSSYPYDFFYSVTCQLHAGYMRQALF